MYACAVATLQTGNLAQNVIVNPQALVESKPMLSARYNVPIDEAGVSFKELNPQFSVACTTDLSLIGDDGGVRRVTRATSLASF